MSENAIIHLLLSKGKRLFNAPKKNVYFTGIAEADTLLNDLINHPHAFVLGCVMDRQIKAERAWAIPFRFGERLGSFAFSKLRKLTAGQVERLMKKPTLLHRFPDEMSKNFHFALRLIAEKYSGNASGIWNDTPSSADVVYRFLEFRGVGPKLATMAANILARDFKIPLADYYSVDISVDVQVRRVLTRLHLVQQYAATDQIIYRARGLSPEFPGLLDFPVWEIGKKWCKQSNPLCDACYMNNLCPSRKTANRAVDSDTVRAPSRTLARTRHRRR